MEGNRLDVRVNLGPLLRPVSSDLMMTADDAPLKCPRPCHVRGHGGEGGGEIPRVERSVRRAEQFDFRRRLIWHEDLQGSCITAAEVYVSCGICSSAQKKKSVFGGSIPNRFSLEAT